MQRLNYRHLFYFWQVARSGHLTRSAEQLHISQSALSAQIQQLERSMEVQLFERRGRTLQLTATGQRVLGYAEEIFRKGEELESMLRHGIEPEFQQLRIGTLSSMSRNFIDQFIAPLLHDSRVRFSLHAGAMAPLLDGLAQHRFDLILTNTAVSGDDGEQSWQVQLLDRQPLAIVGPPQGRPDGDFPHGYEGWRWVLPGAGSEIRAAFDGFCSLHQYRPDVLAEVDDMAMLRLLARDSGALALLPEVVAHDEIASGILVPYMTLPNVHESFYAVTVRRQFMPDILRRLLARGDTLSEVNGLS
ncbi:LysR family transcriptional regulator [Halomonas alkaliantarctica]|nr:LysR family transcriptional regulator [Halomonas alkaliantarctica]